MAIFHDTHICPFCGNKTEWICPERKQKYSITEAFVIPKGVYEAEHIYDPECDQIKIGLRCPECRTFDVFEYTHCNKE